LPKDLNIYLLRSFFMPSLWLNEIGIISKSTHKETWKLVDVIVKA